MKVLFTGGIPWVQALIKNQLIRVEFVSRIPYMERVGVVAEVRKQKKKNQIFFCLLIYHEKKKTIFLNR